MMIFRLLPKVAIVAAMRKTVIGANALIRDNRKSTLDRRVADAR
jgi:hypothetical protein